MTETEPLTEASLEVLASQRRVIEEVRELAFPHMVGEPIEQDAMRALLRLAEEQAAERAARQAPDTSGLRAALRETLAHIDAYEDALGHSYCDLNVGGGWASDDCTCGYSEKRERWQTALTTHVIPGES